MWTFSRATCRLLAVTGLCIIGAGTPAHADGSNYQNNSQFGMNLPYAALPNGQDEIRTADGTSCRSAVGGDGSYLDSGVIGTPGGGDVDAATAVYGRIVIPIGTKAKRLDCTKLYDLEIQRLKMELQLARMGLAGTGAPEGGGQSGSRSNANWQNEGWSSAAPTPAASKPEPQNLLPGKKAKKIAKPAVQVIDSIY